jgi:hypothetical protein
MLAGDIFGVVRRAIFDAILGPEDARSNMHKTGAFAKFNCVDKGRSSHLESASLTTSE